jgi:hypothetical protein
MLVVRLELHDPRRQSVQELGQLVITESRGDQSYADYVAALGEADQTPHAALTAPRKRSQVHDHPRSESGWTLVAKALRSLGFAGAKGRRSECE